MCSRFRVNGVGAMRTHRPSGAGAHLESGPDALIARHAKPRVTGGVISIDTVQTFKRAYQVHPVQTGRQRTT